MEKRPLHVIGCPSAAGILRQVLRPRREELLISEDPLSCGPAPATTDLALWRATRERFLQEIYRSDLMEFSFDGYAEVGLLMNAQRLHRADEVAVWVAPGLPDQLLLAWTVFLCDRVGADLAKLKVVQFPRLMPDADWPLCSMGELSLERMRDRAPAPRPLSAEEAEELRHAWQVYTSDDPAGLVGYAAGNGPLPFLRQAMGDLLCRYPDIRSGLGSHDEMLLRLVAKGDQRAVGVLADVMGSEDSLDRAEFDYLFWRLLRLADHKSPLVALTARTMRDSRVRLTPFGEAVLAGKANTVRENGLDDWIGGVHLITDRPVFRDGRKLKL